MPVQRNAREFNQIPGPSPSLPFIGTNWIYLKPCESLADIHWFT